MNIAVWSTFWQVLANPRLAFERVEDGSCRASAQLVVILAVLSAILLGAVDLLTTDLATAVSTLIKNLVVMPIMALLAWLALSVLMFVVWKILGGWHDFKVAARSVALLFVLLPLWHLAEIAHPLAQLVVIAWAAALLVIASQQVYKIALLKAVIVVGVLALIAGWHALCGCCEEQRLDAAAANIAAIDQAAGDRELVDAPPLVDNDRSATQSIQWQEPQAQSHPQELVDKRFSLSPAQAGHKLGEMVRGVTDSVAEISEEFKRGLEAPSEPAADKEPLVEAETLAKTKTEPSAGKEPSAQKEPSANKEPSAQKELPVDEPLPPQPEAMPDSNQVYPADSDPLPLLSPEQLGHLLGRFIRDMDRVAQDIEQGYNEGLSSQRANQLNAAERAGKAMGDFIRGFNEAVGSLERAGESGDAAEVDDKPAKLSGDQ